METSPNRFVERRFLAAINCPESTPRRSVRATPSPHHTLDQERTARFIARPVSPLTGPLEKCCDDTIPFPQNLFLTRMKK